MRNDIDPRLERGRDVANPDSAPTILGTLVGRFFVHGPCGEQLCIVASDARWPDALGWEHVSVSVVRRKRTPNWTEMCFVKDLFWRKDEAVVQFHPPEAEYVSNHEFCLHLWRNVHRPPEMPPTIFVGIKEVGTIRNAAEAQRIREKYRSRKP